MKQLANLRSINQSISATLALLVVSNYYSVPSTQPCCYSGGLVHHVHGNVWAACRGSGIFVAVATRTRSLDDDAADPGTHGRALCRESFVPCCKWFTLGHLLRGQNER